MKTRGSLSFPLAGIIAAIVIVTAGCEDEAARQRAEAQTVLSEASRELALATVGIGIPGEADEAARKLEAIIGKLSGIRNAEAGQEAAAALLLTTAHQKLAQLKLAAAQGIEAENLQRLTIVHSHIDAALRLNAFADGQEMIDTDDQLATLGGERAGAEIKLGEYSARMAELDGPIAKREQENRSDASEASRLSSEAVALRREATDLGHAGGLDRYLASINLSREADGYEYRIAQRDNDLAFDLRPEHELADSQATYLRSLISQIDETSESLDEGERERTARVGQTRRLIRGPDGLQAKIDAALAESRRVMAEDLDALYTDAAGHLEKAERSISQAVQKSGRSDADAVRVTAARVHEQTSQLNLVRARGLTSLQNVLDRLAAANGTLGPPDAFRQASGDVQAQRDEALDAAEVALGEAREQLGKVNARDFRHEIEAFKASLDRSLAQLSGAPTDFLVPPTTPGGRPAGTPGRSAVRAATGAESPEALVAKLKQIKGIDQVGITLEMTAGPDLSPGLTPNERQIAGVLLGFMTGAANLQSALQSAYGRNVSDLAANDPMLGTMLQVPAVVDITLDAVSGSTGAITVTDSNGEVDTREIMMVGDRWFLGIRDDVEDLSGAGSEAAAGMDPQMVEAMLAGMRLMIGALGEMMSDLANDVTAGTYASFDEAAAATQTRFMEIAQSMAGSMGEGMGGGMGGGPTRPGGR